MTKKQRSLRGKVAIVTGSAQGAGKAIAHALSREGVKVALVDVDQEKVLKAAQEVGDGAAGFGVDVTDHQAFANLFDEVEAQLGNVDVLINNAGIMPIAAFEDESDATAERIIEINYHAPLWSSKEAIRRWRRQGRGGHIVNVASGAAWIPTGGGVSYTGSKFAVLGFTHALSLELHGTGIDVSVVAPGVIKTELSSGLPEHKGFKASTPEEVAAAIVDGLKKPRFAIFVPRIMGLFSLALSAIPYPARDFLARSAKIDKVLLTADMNSRTTYENRVASHTRGQP